MNGSSLAEDLQKRIDQLESERTVLHTEIEQNQLKLSRLQTEIEEQTIKIGFIVLIPNAYVLYSFGINKSVNILFRSDC